MNFHFFQRVATSLVTAVCILVVLHITSLAASAQSMIFQDEFNQNTLDTNSWEVYSIYELMHRTQYGTTPTMQSEAGSGFARFYMDTYTPDPTWRGKYVRGTGLNSYLWFGRGGGVEFEARIRGTNVPRGSVFAFFPYGDKDPGPGHLNDEIDFEMLGNFEPDRIWFNIFNDGQSAEDSLPVPNYNRNEWSVYTARWYPDRVEWYVNGLLIKTNTTLVPDDPMQVHLNFWASDGWPHADDKATLVPVSNPVQNTRYYFDVDYVRVRSLADPIQVIGPGGTGGGTGGSNGSSDAGSPVVGSGSGLTGIYYRDTTLKTSVAKRVDPQIVFDWDNYSPGSGIPYDSFSVRWTGQVQAQYTQPYTFHLESDDGARLWVNDQLLIDNWRDPGLVSGSGTINLIAGVKYNIRLEYYDVTGMAQVFLSWNGPYTSKQFIPQSQLYPTTGAPVVVATPVFSPDGGTYSGSGTVQIICATPGATIHYTTDGSDPTENDPAIPSGEIVPISGTCTLKARAYLYGYAPSAVKSATYTIVTDPAPPGQDTFNGGVAAAGSKAIKLKFNAPLNATVVRDKIRYSVTVSGAALTISKVAYSGNARSGVVTLTSSRILKRGETVVATWQGLLDKTNNPLPDGSWSGTVR
ncbi:MAG TPA: PA14 domain-containing protein [Abditibacteriaceae bacterium]|jgi:hypothetical protein